MAGFYLDHDVAHAAGRELITRGYDAHTAQGLGLELARDDQQLLLTAERGWIPALGWADRIGTNAPRL